MTDNPKKLGLGKSARPAAKFDTSQLGQPSFQRVETGPQPGLADEAQPDATQPSQGQLPLQPGAVVTPASLSAFERAELEKLGWQEGQAIPGNLPELLAREQQAAQAGASQLGQLPPPANPADVPPLEMPPEQDIDELSPEQQARIRAAMAEAQQMAESGQAPFRPAGEGVGDAAAGVVHKQVDISPTIVDDRDSDTYASGEPKAAHRAPEPDATGRAADESMTGLQQPGPKECPHCGWDLAMPDNVEVDEADKQTFLQALVGGRPWQKAYELLGGQMSVTFRQLTPDEVDACYQQTFAERDQGKIENQLDFYEQLNRYRAALQLVDFRTPEERHPFPATLADWGGDPAGPNPTTLPQIIEQIREQVIKTESVQRIVSTMCARFNRLTAKMEANVESPDFWEPTGSPT